MRTPFDRLTTGWNTFTNRPGSTQRSSILYMCISRRLRRINRRHSGRVANQILIDVHTIACATGQFVYMSTLPDGKASAIRSSHVSVSYAASPNICTFHKLNEFLPPVRIEQIGLFGET